MTEKKIDPDTLQKHFAHLTRVQNELRALLIKNVNDLRSEESDQKTDVANIGLDPNLIIPFLEGNAVLSDQTQLELIGDLIGDKEIQKKMAHATRDIYKGILPIALLSMQQQELLFGIHDLRYKNQRVMASSDLCALFGDHKRIVEGILKYRKESILALRSAHIYVDLTNSLFEIKKEGVANIAKRTNTILLRKRKKNAPKKAIAAVREHTEESTPSLIRTSTEIKTLVDILMGSGRFRSQEELAKTIGTSEKMLRKLSSPKANPNPLSNKILRGLKALVENKTVPTPPPVKQVPPAQPHTRPPKEEGIASFIEHDRKTSPLHGYVIDCKEVLQVVALNITVAIHLPEHFSRSVKIVLTPLVEDLYLAMQLFESRSPHDEKDSIIQTEQKKAFRHYNITRQEGEILLSGLDDIAAWIERGIATLQTNALAIDGVRQKVLQGCVTAKSELLLVITKFAELYSLKLANLLNEEKSMKKHIVR